ncbi:hypothetical protein FB45DRAFT_1110185 [Roridomyces roridus]|uniref:Zn(2)-C6 fungal-type domain-containing protein n=1 Tax=Roridomyces roridus TaxID=1738132 RepID=A0AAD7B9T1_9AGAR|nr:hypothetical protein FB45DRAFT_1110185 [Roridomyces roridus]
MSSQANNQGRSTPLRRGKACFNCSHFKIKCDGVTCGPCRRMPKADPCEFNDSLSRTQELEHTVFRLQSQLNELHGGGGVWPSSTAPGSPFSGSSAGLWFMLVQTPVITSQQADPPTGRYWDSRNLPLSLSSPCELLQFRAFQLISFQTSILVPHATQFGFFLHPTRFRDAALLPFTFGDVK